MVVFAHNSQSGKSVSDLDWDEFEQFAETADVLYRYDPNVPGGDKPQGLPWPYHNLTCQTLSSRKAPALPKGLVKIPLSESMREALVATLTRKDSPEMRSTAAGAAQDVGDKRFFGQTLEGQLLLPPVYSRKQMDEVTQMLRDAARGHLPKLPGDANGGQVSIIDTEKGQVVGGFAAGATIAVVPLGPVASDVAAASGVLPMPTREFIIGKSLAEMSVGTGQMIVGGLMSTGGTGLSMTGGGAILGVPTCVAGAAIATNGAIAFASGATTLVLAMCHWDELPAAQPLAASATDPKSSIGRPAAAQAGQSPPNSQAARGITGAADKATSPATSPAKPSAPPNSATPSTDQPKRSPGGQLGSGTQVSPNTTRWIKCTGQVHHAISKKIYDALQEHATLKNVYKARDNRFVTQAIDKAAHKGYETWHRNMEKQVEAWLDQYKRATPAQFEAYLRDLYRTDKELSWRFPNGL